MVIHHLVDAIVAGAGVEPYPPGTSDMFSHGRWHLKKNRYNMLIAFS